MSSSIHVTPVSRKVMNLAHFLRQASRRYPNEVGLAWGSRTWTWRELDRRVDAIAAAFTLRGVSKGDRVLVQSKNCNELFESMFACFRLGAVWVPTNFRQVPEEVAYLAEASGASLMICQAAFPEHAAEVAAVPGVKSLISIGEAAFGESYERLVQKHYDAAFSDAPVEHDDPCWFFFTSGTTGRPKAAVLTHGQMGFVITNHLCDLMPGTTASDASLVVAPLSHGAGIHQIAQVAQASKTVLLANDRFDAEEAWSLVERWRVTNMFTVPTILKMLTEHPSVDRYDHSSLRYVIYAGAPMYREDQKHALRKLGKVLVQYFGLGEVTGNITVLPPYLHEIEDNDEIRIGTCGYERVAMQISIQDEHGNELPPYETGEICVCGLAVFAGYFNNPEANEKAFRDGWFRTGDLGHVDEQGFLFITGRASDMYISGGSNIYPREIEEKILAHPSVAEVAIVSVPDDTWGESGIAVVVLRDGLSTDEPELLHWLEGKIAKYKVPKRIIFWDSLPKSGYGKITKKTIKEELFTRGCLRLAEAASTTT
ncbi:MAG: acyl-CoA synthetase [Vulcanimicrobiaceae bacterium]